MNKIDEIDLITPKTYYSYCNIRALFRAYYNTYNHVDKAQIKRSIGYIIRDKIGDINIINEYYNIVKQSFINKSITDYSIANYDINKSKIERNKFSDKYYDNIKDMCDLMEIIEMVERDNEGAYRKLFLESEVTALIPKVKQTFHHVLNDDLHKYSSTLTGGNNMKKRLLKKYI